MAQQQLAKVQGRARLDGSLMSPALSEREGVLELVREQLLRSPLLDHGWTKENGDKAAEKRAAEIWTLLETLRSARQEVFDRDEERPTSWKIKQETENMRVMYRPGPEGTPFHTYCVEGVVAGSMPNATCVGWEAPSYHAWWPQFTVPTFKIIESSWVKRIRVGEDLALLRVKTPWPLAPREALMTQFELEHFKDDILIILITTPPSDPDEIEAETFGFSGDELPPLTEENVRIDVEGGFIMQRLSSDLNFFRIVVNMDMKVDFVPPAIINFITRQVAGNGYKLYQKAVLAASKGTGAGKVYKELIAREPLYQRIQARLQEKLDLKSKPPVTDPQEKQQSQCKEEQLFSQAAEITEAAVDSEQTSNQDEQALYKGTTIDSEVQWALGVLDRMISIVDKWKLQSAVGSSPKIGEGDLLVRVNGSPSSDGVLDMDRSSILKSQENGGLGSRRSMQLQRHNQHWRRLALKRLNFWQSSSSSTTGES